MKNKNGYPLSIDKGSSYDIVGVDYKIKGDGQAPEQGMNKDFGTDLYLREDTLLIPGAIKAKIAGVGIHTEFPPDRFGMLISLRSSMALLPISLANHIGVVEGTYRGEIMLPLRNTLSSRRTGEIKSSSHVLEWVEKDKELIRTLATTLDTKHHDDTYNLLEAEFKLIGNDLGTLDQLQHSRRENLLPKGTILLRKGTRVAQAYLAPKYAINWQEVDELSDTERGTGGFGSTNNKEE